MSEMGLLASDNAREFITFRIGSQYFCIDILCVREIRGWTPATALPRAPRFVRGVINLRGIVLPVVDLAERFGFAPAEPTPRNVIIVAQTSRQVVGLLVDAVSDIVVVAKDRLQPTPDVGSDAAKAFVEGVMAIEDRLVSLVSLETLMPCAKGEAA